MHPQKNLQLIKREKAESTPLFIPLYRSTLPKNPPHIISIDLAQKSASLNLQQDLQLNT
jgi:hypothetical protein